MLLTVTVLRAPDFSLRGSFCARMRLARSSKLPSGPRVGPVVINEIHYHPAAGGDEFIELRNISGAEVPLFDPANPTNTWEVSGLGYAFPTNLTLPANGLLLVVATNPASFRTKYAVPETVLVLGPMLSALAHAARAPGTNAGSPR